MSQFWHAPAAKLGLNFAALEALEDCGMSARYQKKSQRKPYEN
ncbi:conserved protein of unknown function [Ectopseudomonas oleovorans]|uniref:Uncharacterized protein n=1 Tax=Ectopseudomonas oleovorans TaxID=301 RepID=A0A653B127_ECTOL|nr:conserved protein of unknown function [Pseudomonas oleovorans]